MSKKSYCTGIVLLGTILTLGVMQMMAAASRAQGQLFMREKLAYSKNIVEGLTLENFELISKSAISMRQMTSSNLFHVLKNKDYEKRTRDYQKNIDSLYSAAVDKNIEAASEAYIKVTADCINCHRYFRKAQRTKKN